MVNACIIYRVLLLPPAVPQITFLVQYRYKLLKKYVPKGKLFNYRPQSANVQYGYPPVSRDTIYGTMVRTPALKQEQRAPHLYQGNAVYCTFS